MNDNLRQRAAAIRAIALDVDGTLTDGAVYWGPDGEEWKRFHFLDIMGISRATKAGVIFALISGEDSPLVDRYAIKMKIADVHKGCKDKAAAARAFAAKHGLALSQIAFMGDDVNDVEAMALCGLPSAPSTAHDASKHAAAFVASRAGGAGAVRELIDLILEARAKR